MPLPIVLASGSTIRKTLLENAGLEIEIKPARVDEEMIKQALSADGSTSRDVADALAEAKARKVSLKSPGQLVFGFDQVLDFDQMILSKPKSIAEARDQLKQMKGQTHSLLSAAVIFENGEPLWRHVGIARLTMRDFSDDYLDDYLARNWESIRESVGGYKLEEEGVRLFSRIEGDYFTILGIPMIELLSYLTIRGTLPA